MEVLEKAVFAYTIVTLVAYGDCVFRLRGLASGGALGIVCVALVLGRGEVQSLEVFVGQAAAAFNLPGGSLARVLWRRYVDDVLAISGSLCAECLFLFVWIAFLIGMMWMIVDGYVLGDATYVLAPIAALPVPKVVCGYGIAADYPYLYVPDLAAATSQTR